MSKSTLKVAVLGASGYTGAEAVRLILGHPKLDLAALTAHSQAGQSYGSLYPQFAHLDLPELTTLDQLDTGNVDVALACLPHGTSQDTIVPLLGQIETIIDLSADFRLWSPDLYQDTYGRDHIRPDMLGSVVYGLTEFARDCLKDAALVACPGCYPTCSLLALLPGIEGGLIKTDNIVIDAKSGVTGAGRKASLGLAYSELSDGAHAYGVGNHRHAPEIEQLLTQASGQSVGVSFTPHLLPMNRGMIATCYVTLQDGVSVEQLRTAYRDIYANAPFVRIEEAGRVPQTRHVRGSNNCHIGIFPDRQSGRAIIISVIDNLTKGSSGQAIQNLNVIKGWDESLGLSGTALFP